VATERLDRAPRLATLYPRAVLTAAGRHGDALPEVELVLPGVRAQASALAAYDRVCGFRLADALPATYPHVLAFPLAVRLMTDRRFPFALPGLVHVANRIEQRRPLLVGEPFTLRVRAASLRPHERGTQFDVLAEAEAGGETVWTGASTYLRRSGGSSGRHAETAPTPQAVWEVGRDAGRAYAAVSGDRNPIHLSRLAARVFGFPRAIAHGMWVKARCLAAFEGRLPAAYTVEVAFRAPILLPARVALTVTGHDFALHDARDGRPHLTGTIRG
jgi:acyl dehydratase